jgi:hypothetical protein
LILSNTKNGDEKNEKWADKEVIEKASAITWLIEISDMFW